VESTSVGGLPRAAAREPTARSRAASATRPVAAGEHLESVQLLRAAAALAVIGWHLVWVARAFPGAVPALPRALAFGYAGVDLFFVISGYVICHITAHRPFRLGDFAARRWLRIAPLYALFTGLAALAAFVNPAWGGEKLDPQRLLHSLSLLPMRGLPLLDVGWSLEHEMIFYALAAALLAAGQGRRLPLALALGFGVGVVLHGVVPELTGRRVYDAHLFSLYHVGFLFGVLLFRQRERLAALDWRVPLAIGGLGLPLVAGWVAALYTRPDGSWHVETQPFGAAGVVRALGYALCSGLLLQGLLGAERRGALARLPRLLRACLNRVADASYVLYLSHFFVYSLLAKTYAVLGVSARFALPALALALLAAVGSALAVHVALERPLLRAIGSSATRRRTA
jgi:peptidoglycan/LPS O-acetylase OafA/YrhL